MERIIILVADFSILYVFVSVSTNITLYKSRNCCCDVSLAGLKCVAVVLSGNWKTQRENEEKKKKWNFIQQLMIVSIKKAKHMICFYIEIAAVAAAANAISLSNKLIQLCNFHLKFYMWILCCRCRYNNKTKTKTKQSLFAQNNSVRNHFALHHHCDGGGDCCCSLHFDFNCGIQKIKKNYDHSTPGIQVHVSNSIEACIKFTLYTVVCWWFCCK